jgi:hypothetical protein
MLLSDNNIQNTKIIPLENARYSVLVIYSESKNLAESIQTNGTFFLVEDSQVEKIKNAKMEDLSFLDEDEYSEISDSYSDSELGNIDMSYSQKCENGLKAEVRNQFIEIIKNNKKTPKLNIQKAIDISQISDYREFFLNIEEKVSKFVPQEFHDTIHNMLYLETILVGCYFGSINGELSPDAAFFINDVARFAVVDGDKNSESELINRKNELKSIFASHLKENFIENKEYQDFFRRIILGKLYSLEVFNNMDGNQILQHMSLLRRLELKCDN